MNKYVIGEGCDLRNVFCPTRLVELKPRVGVHTWGDGFVLKTFQQCEYTPFLAPVTLKKDLH
jgi:hypothetical protein